MPACEAGVMVNAGPLSGWAGGVSGSGFHPMEQCWFDQVKQRLGAARALRDQALTHRRAVLETAGFGFAK